MGPGAEAHISGWKAAPASRGAWLPYGLGTLFSSEIRLSFSRDSLLLLSVSCAVFFSAHARAQKTSSTLPCLLGHTVPGACCASLLLRLTGVHTCSHTPSFAGRPHPPALLSTCFGRGASPFPGWAAALGLIMGMALWHAGGQSTGGTNWRDIRAAGGGQRPPEGEMQSWPLTGAGIWVGDTAGPQQGPQGAQTLREAGSLPALLGVRPHAHSPRKMKVRGCVGCVCVIGWALPSLGS